MIDRCPDPTSTHCRIPGDCLNCAPAPAPSDIDNLGGGSAAAGDRAHFNTTEDTMYDWTALADKQAADLRERTALWAGVGIELEAMGVTLDRAPVAMPTIAIDPEHLFTVDAEYCPRWVKADRGDAVVTVYGVLQHEGRTYVEFQVRVPWPPMDLAVQRIVNEAALAELQ